MLGKGGFETRSSSASSFFIWESLLIWPIRFLAIAEKSSVSNCFTTILVVEVTAPKLLHGCLHLNALFRNSCLLW